MGGRDPRPFPSPVCRPHPSWLEPALATPSTRLQLGAGPGGAERAVRRKRACLPRAAFNARCQVALLFLCRVFDGLCGHQIKPGRSPIFHGVTCWADSADFSLMGVMTRRHHGGQQDPSLGAREGRREVAQAGWIQTPIHQGGARAIILGTLPQSLAPAIFQDRETWLRILPVPPPGSRQAPC